MGLEIKPLSMNSKKEWDDFCLAADLAWFRHTTFFIEYILNCRFDNKSKDLSFSLCRDNRPVAVIPLIAQTVYDKPGVFEFAFTDTNVPFPAFQNGLGRDDKNDLLKIIFNEVDRIALENDIGYSRFFVDPLSEDVLQCRQKINPLTKFGYQEVSLSTNIISLRLSEDEIFSNIRKGHKSDIKTAKRKGFEVDIFDENNITRDTLYLYKDMHLRDAGRKTRPDASWDMMYEFIKNGKSILALLKKDEKYIAGALVIIYKKKAYYGSGASDPDFADEKGIGHLLQWAIVEHLKRTDNEYYEIGWNFYPVISQEVISDKEMSISKFKSGFGGDLYPLFRGEKFYSKDYLLSIYARRADEYARKLSV